jgi:hypothetical protein
VSQPRASRTVGTASPAYCPARLSGAELSPLSALNVLAVRGAGDLISGIMGTLPVAIYQEADGGGQEVADDHPGQFLVAQIGRWLPSN